MPIREIRLSIKKDKHAWFKDFKKGWLKTRLRPVSTYEQQKNERKDLCKNNFMLEKLNRWENRHNPCPLSPSPISPLSRSCPLVYMFR